VYVVLWANFWIFLGVLVTVAFLCYREYDSIVAQYGFGAPGWIGYGAGLLLLVWGGESGGTMPIMAMTIDSGFRPQMVYEFAARHPQPAHGPAGDAIAAPRTVVATKGKPDFLKLIASVSPTDASRKRQNVRIWHIGTHWAKQEFYDWLRIVLPDDGTYPPGYQHYAYKDQDFYRGLCSESRIVRSSGKVEWVPDKSVRNEPLDLAVLCRAAAAVCGIDRFSEEDWAAIEGIIPAGATKAPPNDGYWGGRDDLWGARGGGKNWFK
ncbi:MAG: phage terminase large subunit family protein, partial [Acidobacteriia bacterium]|nr:phage terminase large subunit family protein [Terriglobia bacterium]